MPPLPPRSRRRGFTLVELLVAISVLSLMILLANRVFLDVRRLVSRGMETSQIIASERAISDPLLKDARAMRVAETGQGATSPGFLLLVQDRILPTATTGVRFPPAQGRIGSVNDFPPAPMRSDQMVFFRDANGLESLVPGFDDDPSSLARANTARVWYGHTSPVAALGSSLSPGESDGSGEVRNDIANELVLGRQVLLLVEDNNSTVFPNGNFGSTRNGTANDGRVASANGDPLDRLLSQGFSDVFSLANGYEPTAGGGPLRFYDDNGNPAASGERALFRTPGWQDPSTFSPTMNLSFFDGLLTPAVIDFGTAGAVAQWDEQSRLPTADYAAAALEWAFAREGHRLQTDVEIRNDFSTGIFTADDLARLHAAFVPHVADFEIDFAADFIDDLETDPLTGEVTAGTDGFPDLEPDRDDFGNIRWYTGLAALANPDTDNDGMGDNDPARPVVYDGTIDVAAFDGNPAANPTINTINNPFVYEAADLATGPLSDFAPPAGTQRAVVVFAHSGDDAGTQAFLGPDEFDVIEGSGKYWPYLLRIRYRLMDGSGKFRSIDPVTNEPIVGRWFEQIIPVPRPTGTF